MHKEAGTRLPARLKKLAVAVLLGLCASQALADTALVAVASNFARTIKMLVPVFYQQTGHDIRPVYASSGKLYAQIKNGAPFDVFLSADDEKTRLLAVAGLAVDGSRFIYAEGRLVLWSAEKPVNRDYLRHGDYRTLAIANPRLAPYGVAAMQVIKALDAGDTAGARLVMGENIGQAWQFARTGNADIALVAASQVDTVKSQQSHSWQVPEALYKPIRQEAVLLENGAANDAARAFMRFLCSAEARTIIENHGYRAGAGSCS